MIYFAWLVIMVLVGFVCAITGVPWQPYGWIWLGITYGGVFAIILILWFKKQK